MNLLPNNRNGGGYRVLLKMNPLIIETVEFDLS